MLYNTLYQVASSRLFLDIQEVTLLLGEYTLFSVENLNYPSTRLCSYFTTISVAHVYVYTRTMGCKKSFRYMLACIVLMHVNSQIFLLKIGKIKKCEGSVKSTFTCL